MFVYCFDSMSVTQTEFYFVWLFGKFFIYYLVSFYSLTVLSVGFLLSVSSCLLIVGRSPVVCFPLSVFRCRSSVSRRFRFVGRFLVDFLLLVSRCRSPAVSLLLSVSCCWSPIVGFPLSVSCCRSPIVGFLLLVSYCRFPVVSLLLLVSCCRFPVVCLLLSVS